MKAASQRNQVLQFLTSGAVLTPKDARRLWGCDRLAARIKELRDQGWDIVDDRQKYKTRHSVYRLRTIGGQGLLMPLDEKGRPE